MRRSPRPGLLGLALMLMTTSCALFTVPDDVGIKKLGVDLTFGGKLPTTPPGPSAFSLPPVPTITPSPPPDPGPPPPPPPPLCGPTTAVGAIEAPTSMHADPDGNPETDDGQQPLEGNYPFHFIGNLEGGPQVEFDANKVITNSQLTNTPGGFEYDIGDPFLPGMRFGFESRPESETDPVGAGLYLTKIEIPFREPGQFFPDRQLLFEPQGGLKFIEFPIQSGTTITRSAPDIAPKEESPVQDPITGAPILLPSANEMTSQTTIHSTERIVVCEELAQAWRTSVDIQITGDYNIRFLGTFWLGTQFGGWPIKDDFVVVGDLAAGNYSSNLLKVDPGDYI